MWRTLAALAAMLTLVAAPAFAGIADTPLPAGTNYLFSVPDVRNAGTVGTFIPPAAHHASGRRRPGAHPTPWVRATATRTVRADAA